MRIITLIQGWPGARRIIGRRAVPFIMNPGCLLLLDVSTQCSFRPTTIMFLQICVMTLHDIARAVAAHALFLFTLRPLLILRAHEGRNPVPLYRRV